MLPGISIRINNLIKAMEKTIVPALKSDSGLAQEQAALVIGHLKMLDQQWDKTLDFETGSLNTMRAYAQTLINNVVGDVAISEAKLQLEASLKTVPSVLPTMPSLVNQHTITIGHCVDQFITTCYRDGTSQSKEKILKISLDYGAKQSMRERVWFNATNLDPDKHELVSIDDMLSAQ